MTHSIFSHHQFRPLPAHRQSVGHGLFSNVLLALALFGAAISAHATSGFDEDFDNQDKSWKEITIQMPGKPQDSNLLRFYVSPIATQTFAIDAQSVSAGADGVVRYSLVATSRSGARNLSYEGIRCQSMEKKLYAFGRADGTWSRSRKDQWEPIDHKAANAHHSALARDYFCQNGGIAGTAEMIIDRMRTERRLAF